MPVMVNMRAPDESAKNAASPANIYLAEFTVRYYTFFVTLMISCLGGAVVERWTRDRKVAGSTPGRGAAIKSTRSTQPSIPPG